MFNKKNGIRLVLIFMTFAMLFTACKSTPASKAVGPEMAAWKGEWISISTIAESEKLDSAYEETAKAMPNYSAGGLKDAVNKIYSLPVLAMKADGTNLLTLSILDKNKKSKTVKCEYKFEGKVEMPKQKGKFWYTFKAVNLPKELRAFRFLVITEIHFHDNEVAHWHARFGAVSMEALTSDSQKVLPTFVSKKESEEKIIELLKTKISETAKNLPVAPFSAHETFKDVKDGKWINLANVMNMESEEIDAVYEKFIKKYAGQNPKGGDFTKEELQKMAKDYGNKMAGAGIYSHLQFVTKNGKNKVIFWNNNEKIFESEYIRISANKINPGFMAIEAKEKTDAFKTIICSPPHYGHMHMLYGNSNEEIEKNGFGTCIPANSSAKTMAGMFAYTLNLKMNSVIKNNKQTK